MVTIVHYQNLDIIEFRSLIREIISEEMNQLKIYLEKQKQPENTYSVNELLSMNDAAALLKVSTVTLQK